MGSLVKVREVRQPRRARKVVPWWVRVRRVLETHQDFPNPHLSARGILAITSQIPERELSPELRKARILALQAEVHRVRVQEHLTRVSSRADKLQVAFDPQFKTQPSWEQPAQVNPNPPPKPSRVAPPPRPSKSQGVSLADSLFSDPPPARVSKPKRDKEAEWQAEVAAVNRKTQGILSRPSRRDYSNVPATVRRELEPSKPKVSVSKQAQETPPPLAELRQYHPSHPMMRKWGYLLAEEQYSKKGRKGGKSQSSQETSFDT
jgi:hypothetical protein